MEATHAPRFGEGEVELVPTAVAAGGDAIARDAGGRVVFVTGALPGERVRVAITSSKKDYAKAIVVDVLDASPDRVAPPCPTLARGCGGCGWQHVAVDAQRRLKRDIVVDALRRLGGVRDADARVDESVALAAEGYRTTVRLAVHPDGRLGYRRAASHDVVTTDDCLVLHPLLAAHLGDRFPGAREVTLRCGARTGDVLIHPHPGEPDRPWYTEQAAGRTWRISADSFFQVRADGADALVDTVRAAVDDDAPSSLVDLYAGVGLFAGTLGAERTIAVEGAKSAAADARVNVPDADVVEADVTHWEPPDHARHVDAVVADPSRHGLGSRGLDVVVACAPAVVVLVSCDPAALGRDARLLRQRGYALAGATPVDLFPHTTHVEVVSRFVPAST